MKRQAADLGLTGEVRAWHQGAYFGNTDSVPQAVSPRSQPAGLGRWISDLPTPRSPIRRQPKEAHPISWALLLGLGQTQICVPSLHPWDISVTPSQVARDSRYEDTQAGVPRPDDTGLLLPVGRGSVMIPRATAPGAGGAASRGGRVPESASPQRLEGLILL